MIKIACFLTGDQYSLVSVDTPESRKKIIALAMAMMVPVVIWFLIGYMLTHVVLQNSLLLGILAGITCATMIFIIEKLVIMAKGTAMLAVFRVCIGLLIAILGGIALDEVIFSKDIDNQIELIKADRINQAKSVADSIFNVSNDVSVLENQIVKAQNDYDLLSKSALLEADGTSGTGAKGVGRVAMLKNQKAAQQFAYLGTLQQKRDSIMQKSQAEIIAAGTKAEDNFDGNGLMTRIDAFFELVFSKAGMATMYIFVTLFFFFLEFLVIILKKSLPKTNYEKNLELIEQIGDQRRAFLSSAKSALADPAYFIPELKDARVTVGRDHPIFRLPKN